MSEDRNKCPQGYEVFGGANGWGWGTDQENEPPFLWTEAEAIAAAWAHHDRIVAEAVREERERIVAALRRDATDNTGQHCGHLSHLARYESIIADWLERGEHEGGGDGE